MELAYLFSSLIQTATWRLNIFGDISARIHGTSLTICIIEFSVEWMMSSQNCSLLHSLDILIRSNPSTLIGRHQSVVIVTAAKWASQLNTFREPQTAKSTRERLSTLSPHRHFMIPLRNQTFVPLLAEVSDGIIPIRKTRFFWTINITEINSRLYSWATWIVRFTRGAKKVGSFRVFISHMYLKHFSPSCF
jgi:hypothetical protein